MNFMTWWLRAVAVLYLVLGLAWLPPLTLARLDSAVPGFDGPAGGAAARGFADYLLMFGLELLVLAIFLLVASFRRSWWVPAAWLVIALSAVRGILDDVYMIAAGYPIPMFLGFIALHAAVILTGVIALRRLGKAAATPQS